MLRCAIYTRKSTEEGLEQDFNSLDAQREACEAYLRSQKHEGWKLIKDAFDDGGYSGGSMDRPALGRLLESIKNRQVDVVVVYKVDRLTRSLADFAKMVELFDAHGVSFVSVTQQFNTTSSMGRLTLNVLLSFAQFEREVTAERIRDKIAASKKKGLWMGGNPPLGYDIKDKKLVVNKREAETVRILFRLYLDLGTVRRLKEEADRLGIISKLRKSPNGKETGGKPLTRGNLYQLLSNPLYAGRVGHKGATHKGQHPAIIDNDTWAKVQDRLANNAANRRYDLNAGAGSLLTGLVYDEAGDKLAPTHTNKKGRHYRYYISSRLVHGAKNGVGGWRLPAMELEKAVLGSVKNWLRDQKHLMDALYIRGQSTATLALIHQRAESLAAILEGDDHKQRREIMEGIVKRIDLSATFLAVTFSRDGLAQQLGLGADEAGEIKDVQGGDIQITVPFTFRRRGVGTKLIIPGERQKDDSIDHQLCRLIARARVWFDGLVSGEVSSIRALAKRENIHESDVSRVLQLAFLAPDIVEAILAGRQPSRVTVYSLKRLSSLPGDWATQRKLLGFAASPLKSSHSTEI
jgi:DNA invertase Pin-like site-specific DNA recombinase